MNNSEFSIYCVQLIAILFGFVILEKRYRFLPLSIYHGLALLVASIFLAAVSAYLAELDSRKYMKDAILLMSFLEKDKSLYGLFFLTGGNGLYPDYYFPMLIASNTWSNYTSFTIEKFYLFFSLISKPNLYNISLFFGTLSFLSKSLVLKTIDNLDKSSTKLKILWFFLLCGGLEIYFVSGVYKENLLFFFLSFLLYSYYSPFKWWKFILALVCLLHALFLRLDTTLLLALTCIGFWLFHVLRKFGKWRFLLAILVLAFILVFIDTLGYDAYAFQKLSRYARLKPGNTHFDTLDWNSNLPYLLIQIMNRWKQALFSFYLTTYHLIVVSGLGIITWIGIAVLFIKQTKPWQRLTIYFGWSFLLFISIASLFIPNYMALLRYRSPLFILLVFGLILNLKLRDRNSAKKSELAKMN